MGRRRWLLETRSYKMLHGEYPLTEKSEMNKIMKNARLGLDRLFDLDGVRLEFTEEALRAAATQAIERKTGARGLRAIFESAMLDIMYEVPSQDNIDSVIINEEVITKGAEPLTKIKNVA